MAVDIVSDLKPQQVRFLAKMLESSYYIDEDAILEAIRRHSSFNLIHLETMIKVDVFIVGDEPYPQQALHRRRKDTLDTWPSAAHVWASPTLCVGGGQGMAMIVAKNKV
ncbi:MAG: hypothetical protein KAV99_06650 [Candidatus Latescibacteria bacterium]|nr:hypothetical protein [Candidatus Latescibacterota bacterium]